MIRIREKMFLAFREGGSQVHYLYIIVSRTNTKMGWCIRRALNEPYNHVSVALDKELGYIYSFARKRYYTPLIGGMVRESINILTHNRKKKTDVKIYELEVSKENYANIVQQINSMYQARNQYYYNYTGALKLLLKNSSHSKNAYTCLEFAMEILINAGFRVSYDEMRKMTPKKLMRLLENKLIYEGNLLEYPYLSQRSIEEENNYFKKINFASKMWQTLNYMKSIYFSS